MHSDRKISLAKRITNCSTLAVICSLVPITWAVAPAQPLLSWTQLNAKPVMKSRNLKIIASVRKGEAKQSLILDISLENISHKEISFRDTNVLIDYSFVIKDRKGKVLPPSEGGRRKFLESGLISHKPPLVLRPGEPVMRQLVITEIYNFTAREVYTITVYRRISLDKGKNFEEVRSNTIKAEVD
jgi:hypothetical protein